MTFITTAGWVAQAVKGAVLHGDADTGIARVCTDARKTEPGDLFVGLRGDRFVADCEIELEVPVSFGGELLPPMRMTVKVSAGYAPRF